MRILAFLGVVAIAWGQTPAAKPPASTPKPAASAPAAAKPPAAAAKPAAAKPVVAKVSLDDPIVFQAGDEALTRSQFDQFLALLPDQVKGQVNAPGGKRQLAERLAEMKILSQEARRQKIDQKPDMQQQLLLQRDQFLAGMLYQSMMEKAKLTDADARKYYEEHKKEYEQAKARHILIRFQGSPVPVKPNQKDLTDAEALQKIQELRTKIQGGADFAALAKAESDDSGSGANGGDLGTFARGRMVPQFEEAAFTMTPGQLSEPIKTQFGYHLIQLQERGAKPFEEAKADIERKAAPEAAKHALDDLKKSSKITLDDTYFPPATPANPAGAK